jgi:hypothetical protein
MPTSPDDGLFEVDDSGAAPSARVVPEGHHPWAPSSIAKFEQEYLGRSPVHTPECDCLECYPDR